MAATSKYIPRPTGLDAEWNRLTVATGKVHVQRCSQCSNHQHPPRRFCASCGSTDVAFVPTANRGAVYSWVVSHFTVDSGWIDDLPYATVLVQLSEGPRIVGAYSGDASTLSIGMPVSIRPDARSEDFSFLWVDG
jgi:uncharacterized protein